ncbi:MAG: hypothetical protein NVS3B20_20500 [Polyangiales bacterium]
MWREFSAVAACIRRWSDGSNQAVGVVMSHTETPSRSSFKNVLFAVALGALASDKAKVQAWVTAGSLDN